MGVGIMQEAELIATQAMRIADLEEAVADKEARLQAIRQRLVCIGGPLNDNLKGYTPHQLIDFRAILTETE